MGMLGVGDQTQETGRNEIGFISVNGTTIHILTLSTI